MRTGDRDDLADGIVIGRGRQAGIERLELGPQDAGQHHLAVRRPAEQTVRPEILGVVGVHRPPAQFLLQVLGSCLLDEGLLGVGGGCHSITSQ